MNLFSHKLLITAACMAVCLAMPSVAEEPEPSYDPDYEEEDTSVIRVSHAEIEGKVYIASQEAGLREQPADDVNVQIKDLDDQLLSETLTDEEGSYTLPRIDVGEYKLHIGGLTLNLSVEEDSDRWDEQLRKVVIVIIPEQMARRR